MFFARYKCHSPILCDEDRIIIVGQDGVSLNTIELNDTIQNFITLFDFKNDEGRILYRANDNSYIYKGIAMDKNGDVIRKHKFELSEKTIDYLNKSNSPSMPSGGIYIRCR